MYCRECGGKTIVIESRSIEEGTFRKRRCRGCGRMLYTSEYEDHWDDGGRDGIKAYWKKWRYTH